MQFKLSAATLYVKLINQWIDALKTMDAKTLRFIRGNLKTFVLLSSRNKYASMIGVSNSFLLPISDHSIEDLAQQYNVELLWKGERFESVNEHGKYCVVTTLRAMTLRRLLAILQLHHLKPSSVKALLCLAGAHYEPRITERALTILYPNSAEDMRDHFFFTIVKSKSEGKKAGIKLIQAASFARKADGRPVIAAGTQILVELLP